MGILDDAIREHLELKRPIVSANMDTIKSGYDMRKHGVTDAKERLIGGSLTPEFVKRFAVIGNYRTRDGSCLCQCNRRI